MLKPDMPQFLLLEHPKVGNVLVLAESTELWRHRFAVYLEDGQVGYVDVDMRTFDQPHRMARIHILSKLIDDLITEGQAADAVLDSENVYGRFWANDWIGV